MPPKKPTEDEEAAFMHELLGGLDASVFTMSSSPVKENPKRTSPPRTPTKSRDIVKIELSQHPDSCLETAGDLSMDTLIDGADNWDWDDMECDFMTPKKARPIKQESESASLVPHYTPYPCTRCIVEQVQESSINGRYCKNLIVITEPAKRRCSVILCDEWSQSEVRIGDTVNVMGSFETFAESSSTSPEATISITSKANYFIHHPDILLTATAIANAPQCRRKPILSSLVRSTSDVTPALVWGNMLHEVMQACLSHNRWEERWIEERIDEVVRNGLGELVKIGVSVDEAKREVKVRAKGLQTFASRYIAQVPKADAVLTNTRASEKQQSLLAISKLHDVEEDIWSPSWGLKGKLDASVQAIIEEREYPFATPITRSYPMPLELKTGRVVAGMEHRAQTMLYTLLMAERYKADVPSGLLFYTHTEEVVKVPAARLELKGLILARNEIAGYMVRRHRVVGVKRAQNTGHQAGDDLDSESFLPPTIDDERTCKRCYAWIPACFTERFFAVERVEDHSSPIADIYALKTAHLTPTQLDFFKTWEALISLEEQDLMRFKKELWTMAAKERETKGRCFACMVIDTSYCPPAPIAASQKEGKIHQHTYKFIRKVTEEGTSLLNGHMSCGDAVTISVEPDLLALTRGFITELTPTEVVVGVDHELNINNILSLCNVPATLSHDPFSSSSSQDNRVVFRIDRDELFSGMARIRENLAQLFYVDGDTRRLQLVVDLMPPEFEDNMDDDATEQVSAATHLNEHQKEAMKKVMTAHDYALILGMPGTGKTTVIATIIKALVSMGKTVLLTSYTHSAVDNILLKLKGNVDFGILRLGNVDKIHPHVQEFTPAARQRASTVEQLEHQLITPPVVATTCLSIDNPLFLRRKFDYCIVDEASQITLPTCLGPLRFADKFVLVGDHFQLPPLVRSVSARKGGLDVSLFRRLSDAHPHAVVDLALQYRMNEDIMILSNKLIYGDRLRCGSETVAKRSLCLPNPKAVKAIHRPICYPVETCWLHKLMAESCKAVFVDTDGVPACDSRVGDLVQNEVEARLVQQMAEALLVAGVSEEQIGIISLYRQQIKLLSHLLLARKGIEILTADRSQGRDKECIIISMVRSNDSGQIGELVRDWRRMNVSFTRARSKLIIFGSRKTLQTAPLLSEFFDLMQKQGWIVPLPAKADTLHTFAASQTVTKRSLEVTGVAVTPLKENKLDRPTKKVKRVAEEGLLRSRPLLKDLVNGSR